MKKRKLELYITGKLMSALMVGRPAIFSTGGEMYHTAPVVKIHETETQEIHFETSGFFPMMYPSFPNLGPSWPEVRYARFISCFLSSGRVVIMAYSSVFCGKRSTNGMVVFPKNSSPSPELVWVT